MKISNFSDSDLLIAIDSIDEFGKVTLAFSKPLHLLPNISLIDSSVLIITVKSGVGKGQIDSRNLSLTWTSLNMTRRTLKL
jgi:hypothetical protein